MKIVFATANKNKIVELQSLLPDYIELISLHDIGCYEEVLETADTIEGNAVQKANYITEKYGYDCFADDTGLEINALNNEPGVYSARYAGDHKNSSDNIQKVLTNLSAITNRSAQFKTCIALNINNQQFLFTGICKGSIIQDLKGTNGFGYDPIFKPDNYDITFAEMDLMEKNKISHRGLAVQQLILKLTDLTKK